MSVMLTHPQQPAPAMVPFTQYQRACRERDEARSIISAVALIIQDASLTHKQARTRAAVALAIEAQRPAEDPGAPFRADLGDLAKYSGLIPPTPEGDEEARRKAYKSGRKLAGQTLKELANAGALDERRVELERDETGAVNESSVVVRISKPRLDFIRLARGEGTRALQQPRHHNGSRPYCRDCGPDAPVIERTITACFCGRCGARLTEDKVKKRELPAPVADFQTMETSDPDSADFQSLETLETETQEEVQEETGFQSLETGGLDETPVLDDKEPDWLEPIPGNFAQEVIDLQRSWMWSKPEPRGDGKWNKKPYKPQDGLPGSKTNPAHRGTVYEALAAMKRYGGRFVGVALDGHERLVIIDLDKCRNPETSQIAAWAETVRSMLPGVRWELSPSGRGLRGFMLGTKPDGAGWKWTLEGHQIEVNTGSGHFVTVTGHLLPGSPVRLQDCTEQLAALWESARPARPAPVSNGHRPVLQAGDGEVLARATEARNGAKFDALWAGDWGGYPSPSEADLALCGILAQRTQDPGQIDRLFRQSGLYREKWDEPHYAGGMTYGQGTIRRALSDG